MDLDLDNEDALKVYKALNSDTRIDILKILMDHPSTVSEISKELRFSKSIISRYMKILEEARLIKSIQTLETDSDGRKKVYQLTVDHISINFSKNTFLPYEKQVTEIKLGYYSDFDVSPTCGLASAKAHIGEIDDPRAFAINDRVNASLLWFSRGYVDYVIPNTLKKNAEPELLEISLEISSEFPGSNNNYPSDISFYLNGLKVAICTVPGNPTDVRGKLTPDWWADHLSQYGFLRTLRINHADTSINGVKVSDITLKDLDLENAPFIKLRLAVEDDVENVGGLTIFGDSFGNHPQNIMYDLYYHYKNGAADA